MLLTWSNPPSPSRISFFAWKSAALRYANRTEFTLNYFDPKAGGAVPRYLLSYSPTDLVMVIMAFNQSWEDPWYVMEEVGLYPFHPETERPEPLRERTREQSMEKTCCHPQSG